MANTKSDPEREQRIHNEIIVDAYGEEERAIGWYYYLQNQLEFPFTAICISKRAISPLQIEEETEVIGMSDEGECVHEMFVTIRWEKNGLAVPLMQLKPVHASAQTEQAVADWHYWVERGYQF